MHQLAKTNVFLGGQLCWDIVLTNNNGIISIKEVHFAPISQYIPYHTDTVDDFYNYSVTDNIKTLYSRIGSKFFVPVRKPILDTSYPIKRGNYTNDWDTSDNEYDMGVKRAKYSRYNKQFCYFCPFWADNANDFARGLKFNFNVTPALLTMHYSKIDDLTTDESMMRDYIGQPATLTIDSTTNTEFYNYLMQYISDIELDNNLFNINFETGNSNIKGISVEDGIVYIQDTHNIISNLLMMERPLMETDNMLCQLFASNKIIAPQIFNFKFYFDMDDLISVPTSESILDKFFVSCTLGNTTLKDFYSNYDFVSVLAATNRRDDITSKMVSIISSPIAEITTNALDYLQDNKCLNLINKNKLTQHTIHWCLQDNDKYLFNVYNGLSPQYYTYDEDTDTYTFQSVNYSRYWDTPDMASTESTDCATNFLWCNNYRFTKTGQTSQGIKYLYDLTNLRSYNDLYEYNIGEDVFWIGSVKVDVSNYKDVISQSVNESTGKAKFSIITATYNEATTLADDINNSACPLQILTDNYGVVLYKTGNSYYIIILSKLVDGKNPATVNNISKLVRSASSEEYKDDLNILKCVLCNIVVPTQLNMDTSLELGKAYSPASDTEEIIYQKCAKNTTLYRYSGKLYPKFVDTDNVDARFMNYKWNILLFNDISELDDKYSYNSLVNSKYLPNYPSISYSNLQSKYITEYDSYPCDEDVITLEDQQDKLSKIIDLEWFNGGIVSILPPTLVATDTRAVIDVDDPDDIAYIKDTFCTLIGAITSEQQQLIIERVFPLYTLNYDYIINDISDGETSLTYNYTLTFKLK